MKESNIKFTVAMKPTKVYNGYGKRRSNHHVVYGSYAEWYKQSGIYYIKNKINDLIYIGSSKDISSRISKHFSQLRTNKHPNHIFLEDFKKYGQDNFEYGVLELCDENLLEKERMYQTQYDVNKLYNLQIQNTMRSDAQNIACRISNKDSHRTPEYRAKMKAIKSNRIGRFEEATGKLLETFENSDEVCAKYKIAKSTLLGCCNGSKKRALGYVWHYLDERNRIMLQGKGRYRRMQNEDIV